MLYGLMGQTNVRIDDVLAAYKTDYVALSNACSPRGHVQGLARKRMVDLLFEKCEDHNLVTAY